MTEEITSLHLQQGEPEDDSKGEVVMTTLEKLRLLTSELWDLSVDSYEVEAESVMRLLLEVGAVKRIEITEESQLDDAPDDSFVGGHYFEWVGVCDENNN